ncbi:hypothetical protein GP486_008528, partial [Trichoglossum hirsutum]
MADAPKLDPLIVGMDPDVNGRGEVGNEPKYGEGGAGGGPMSWEVRREGVVEGGFEGADDDMGGRGDGWTELRSGAIWVSLHGGS